MVGDQKRGCTYFQGIHELFDDKLSYKVERNIIKRMSSKNADFSKNVSTLSSGM